MAKVFCWPIHRVFHGQRIEDVGFCEVVERAAA